MKVTSSEIEGSQVVLEMEIESERLDKAMDRAYRRLASRVNVPGFRRGKAPRALLERMVGRDTLMEEALDILVPEAYREAVEQTNTDPVGQPKLDIVSAEPLLVKATVPIRPKVKLGDYRSIRQSREAPEITDAQVDETVEHLRESHAEWVPVEHEARAGDLIVADLVARCEDDKFVDEQELSLVLDPERRILAPGVVEQLIGMKGGDSKAFDVTLPEDFTKKELAGKEAVVEAVISEVKEKQIPALDDEFARSVGEYPNMEAVRRAVREELERQASEQARRELEESVLAAVVDQAEADPPTPWVEEQAEMLRRNTRAQVSREGLAFDRFLQVSNMTQESFDEETLNTARRQLKRALVLDAVAKEEGIEVTDEELDAAVQRVVASRPERTISNEERERMRSSMKSALMERKTIDRLVQIAEGSEAGAPGADAEPAEALAREEPVAAESQTKEDQ